jgi:hypothetical protein
VVHDGRPWWETAIDVVETLGAVVACAGIASLPFWLALLLPQVAVVVFVVATVVVLVAPALLPLPGRPELDAGQRWGTRMGHLFGLPLRLLSQRRAARRHRALGASTSTSSTASPSLPPPR